MNTIKHATSFALSAALVGLAAGCGGQQDTPPANSSPDSANSASGTGSSSTTGTNLNGAGATFPYPIYSKWFDEYKAARSVQINYQPVGSGAGIKQVKSGTVDFGASDAPLSDKDMQDMPSPVVHIPTVAGAVAMAYNLPGVTALKLSGPVIADIFLGKIKTWSDPQITALNPGVKLPALAITVGHRSDGSGTTNIFTNYLAAVSPEWKSSVGAGKSVSWPVGLGGKGNDGVASTIKQAPGGIGYIELAYAMQNKLSYASVKNLAGQFVSPDVASTTAAAEGALPAVQKDIRAPIANAAGAKSYPIAGFTYLIVYKQAKNAAKGAALHDFLMWAVKDGQKDAASLNYAPLPTEVAQMDEKIISELK